jgi:hypothetical protein
MTHQEKEAAMVEEPVAAGSSSVGPAGTDQLDLEAAEQLIQLSGGADDDGGSESRSADSVKCSRRGNKKQDKEAAVESRRRSRADAGRSVASAAGKDDCDGGKPDGKGADVEMSLACSMAVAVEEKDKKKAAAVVESPRRSADRPRPAGKDRDGGIVHGEERKRPKFRSLAAIYRETDETTRRVTPPAGDGEGSEDRDPSEGERRKKVKRAAVVIPQDWYMHQHKHVN